MKAKSMKMKNRVNSAADVVAAVIAVVSVVAMILYTLSLLILPLFMTLTSFKTGTIECIQNPFGLPKSFHYQNYIDIIHIFETKMKVGIGQMVLTSVVMSVLKPLITVIFTTFWAYSEAKYDFLGKKFFFSLGIIVMIVPIIGNLPSAMHIYKALNVYDNIVMNILVTPVGCFSGTAFLLLYGIFKNLPWDYAESIFMDGGGRYTAMFVIYIPMALPTMATMFILDFMAQWNDTGTYMLWLPSYPNLAFGMYLFYQKASQFRVNLPQLMAGFTLVMIPTILLYFATNKIILTKFAVGGLKG